MVQVHSVSTTKSPSGRATSVSNVVRRIRNRTRRRLTRWLPFSNSVRIKNFRGTLWDRLDGLEYLLDRCRDCSVLDVASCEGLISYEFVRCGASLVHGLEKDRDGIMFSRRLFRDVPVASRFEVSNLAVPRSQFQQMYGDILLPKYDIVLFLGIFHHLKKQMAAEDLTDMVEEFLERTAGCFAVRSNYCSEIEPLILSRGFRVASSPARRRIGQLRIYARSES